MFLLAFLLAQLEALLLLLFTLLALLHVALLRQRFPLFRECLLRLGGRPALSELLGSFALPTFGIARYRRGVFLRDWLGETQAVPPFADE